MDVDFPCSLIINIPLPTVRLADAAIRALEVDQELSPLVKRSFTLVSADCDSDPATAGGSNGVNGMIGAKTVLRTEYKATTNRMLRVAVNGFMESVGVVLGVMEELDSDVLG